MNFTKLRHIQLIQTIVIYIFFLLDVSLSWNFVEFHEYHFLTDAEISAFYIEKHINLFLKNLI